MRTWRVSLTIFLVFSLILPVLARPGDRLRQRRQQQQTGNQAGREWLALGFALGAARIGNFRTSYQILQNLSASPTFAENQIYLNGFKAVLLDSQGAYSQAYPLALDLLKETQGSELELPVRLLLVQIGRHSGRAEVVQEHLPQVTTLMKASQAGPLVRFAAKTFEVEGRILKMDPEELLAAHQKVRLGGVPAGLTKDAEFPARWVAEAELVWLSAMQRWFFRLGPDHPTAHLLKQRIEQEFTHLGQLAEWFQQNKKNLELLGQVYLIALELCQVGLDYQEVEEVIKVEKELQAQREQFLPQAQTILTRTLNGLNKIFKANVDPEENDLSRLAASHEMLKARLLMAQKKPGAEVHLQKAKTLIGKAPDYDRWLQLNSLVGQYYLLYRPADWDSRALKLADEFESRGRQSGSRVATCLATALRGVVKAEAGQPALTDLEQAAEQTEALVAEAGGVSPEKLHRLARMAESVYTHLIDLYVADNQSQKALEAFSRLQEMRRVVGFAGVKKQSGGVAALSEKAEAARTRSRALQNELQSQQALPESERNAETEAQVSKLLAETRAEFYEAVRELRAKDPGYASTLAVNPVDYIAVQKSLDPDTVVISPYLAEERIVLFVISKDVFKMHQVEARRERVVDLVKQFRRQVTAYSNNPVPFDWNSQEGQRMLATLSELHRYLIEPAGSDLSHKKRIAFVPTGALHYFPTAALASKAPDGTPQFLVEQYELATFAKVTDLTRTTPSQAGKGRPVVVGNPDGSLPQAEKEAQQIGQMFPGSLVLLSSEATEKRLAAAGTSRFLHLATHGVLTARDLNSSFLVLAGEGEQSRLRADEVLAMGLDDTELVTLSACETALGEWTPGANVSSLAEAFALAGSRSVLASLWKVADASTEELMVEFYGQLASQTSKSEALRQAQLKLLKGSRYQHPFHWAAFVLTGDWR